jgi:hypothetical protein
MSNRNNTLPTLVVPELEALTMDSGTATSRSWPRYTDASSQKPHEESPATLYEREASEDSRGGTRTRDPGIMSAVL